MSDRLDLEAIKARRGIGQPPLWPQLDWLIAEVERLRQENDGLRESIHDWRHTADMAGQQARRTVGLEAAASSAFAEVERLRGLLARLEWAGSEWDGDEPRERTCPACDAARLGDGVQQPETHKPDCWLGAELGAS